MKTSTALLGAAAVFAAYAILNKKTPAPAVASTSATAAGAPATVTGTSATVTGSVAPGTIEQGVSVADAAVVIFPPLQTIELVWDSSKTVYENYEAIKSLARSAGVSVDAVLTAAVEGGFSWAQGWAFDFLRELNHRYESITLEQTPVTTDESVAAVGATQDFVGVYTPGDFGVGASLKVPVEQDGTRALT